MAQSINLSNLENLILRNVKVKKEVFAGFLESNQEIVEEFLNEIKEAAAGRFHTEYPQVSWVTLEKVLSKYGKEYFKDVVSVEISTKKRYYDRNLIVKTKVNSKEEVVGRFILGKINLNINIDPDEKVEVYTFQFISEEKIIKELKFDFPLPKLRR